MMEAGKLLGITERHLRRLLKSYLAAGESGLVSKRRGKPGNNRIKEREKAVMMLLVEGIYGDFGPTLASEKLWRIFSLKSERTISKNLELSYKNTIYQILVEGRGISMINGTAVVCEDFAGNVKILYKGREMNYRTFLRPGRLFEEKSSKTLNKFISRIIAEQDGGCYFDKKEALQLNLDFMEGSCE